MHLSISIASETRAFGKAMRRMAWDAVRRSIKACPFSAPDRAAFARLLAEEEQRAFANT